MPTPFTHLAAARRLMNNPDLPAETRTRLRSELPAFLLGNIAADATRLHAPGSREDTHFYRYDEDMVERPWCAMLRSYPQLLQPRDEAHCIFLAGYAAHLAMDEVWTQQIMWPLMRGVSDPGERRRLALVITLVMTRCDERDYQVIDEDFRQALARARPASWLPFLNDADLRTMRDLILRQLRGCSETLDILSRRWGLRPRDFRATLDEPALFERNVLAYIPERRLAEVEGNMDAYMVVQVRDWLATREIQSSSTAGTRN